MSNDATPRINMESYGAIPSALDSAKNKTKCCWFTLKKKSSNGKRQNRQTKWQPNHSLSIWITYAALFVIKLQCAVFVVSLWPYLAALDEGSSLSFYGGTVTVNQLTETLACLLLGCWANKINQIKLPVATSVALGNLGYLAIALAQEIGTICSIGPRWLILIGQALTGIQAGAVSNLNAYLAMGSEGKTQKSAFFAHSRAILCFANVCGILLQLLGLPIGEENLADFNWISLNMYTIPAFCNVAIGTVLLFVLIRYFQESWISVVEDQLSEHQQSTNYIHETLVSSFNENWGELATSIHSINNSRHRNGHGQQLVPPSDKTAMEPYDKYALLVCLLNACAFGFCTVVIRTLITPFTIVMLDFSVDKALLYLSILSIGSYISQVFVNLIVPLLLRYTNPRSLVLSGGILLSAFFVVTFPYPWQSEGHGHVSAINGSSSIMPGQSGSGDVVSSKGCNFNAFNTSQTYHSSSSSSAANASATDQLCYQYNSLKQNIDNAIIESNFAYHWSNNTTLITEEQLIIGYLSGIGIGISVLYNARILLFSNIVGPRKQGTLMGIYHATIQLGGISGPMIATILFEKYGPGPTWLINIAIGVLVSLVVIGYYRYLVDWPGKQKTHYTTV